VLKTEKKELTCSVSKQCGPGKMAVKIKAPQSERKYGARPAKRRTCGARLRAKFFLSEDQKGGEQTCGSGGG